MEYQYIELSPNDTRCSERDRIAIRQGVSVVRRLPESASCRNINLYNIPCEICGEKILKTAYSLKRTYICKYCRSKIEKKETPSIPEGTETRKERQFKKAVDRIHSQVKDFAKYENAIRIAEQKCECYGSIPEAMVAIELIRLGYSIIPQQKITKYKVDFAIPKEKLIIEVDGSVFHKEITEREAVIQFNIGLDWKIIHIPAERIEKKIYKLNEVIEALSN